MLTHNTIACATEGCFAVVTLHPDEEDRLRRTHESFYCPAGHSMSFRGATAEEKRIDELERRLEIARDDRRYAHEWVGRIHAAAILVAAGARTCPLGCGYQAPRQPRGLWQGDEEAIGRYLARVGDDLVEHLLTDHNATRRPVALLTEGTPA